MANGGDLFRFQTLLLFAMIKLIEISSAVASINEFLNPDAISARNLNDNVAGAVEYGPVSLVSFLGLNDGIADFIEIPVTPDMANNYLDILSDMLILRDDLILL